MADAEESSPLRDVALDAPCPSCGSPGLRMRSMALDIPYFGEALQTTVLCEACGFRHADVLQTRQGPPSRHRLVVQGPQDLSAKIVRSSSCTVRVVELGAVMEPGLRSEAFISTAEGVLHRFREIVGFLTRNASTESRRRAARQSLERLQEMIEGRRAFTIILEDPFGNSAILHEGTEVDPLSDEEVRGLKTGVFTVDLRPGVPRSRERP